MMPIESFYYRIIPEDEVPAECRRLAWRAIALAEKKLGAYGIRIRWVRPATRAEHAAEDAFRKLMENMDRLAGKAVPGFIPPRIHKHSQEFWGVFFPLLERDAIYIRADLPRPILARTVGHECKHVADFKEYGATEWWNVERREGRAESFGRELAGEIG